MKDREHPKSLKHAAKAQIEKDRSHIQEFMEKYGKEWRKLGEKL